MFNTTLVNYVVICGNRLTIFLFFFSSLLFFLLFNRTSARFADTDDEIHVVDGVRSKFVRTLEGVGYKSSPRSPRASSYINGNDLV